MSKNIHFDENFQIRALDPEMHAHSAKTEAEAKEFMDRAWHRRFSYMNIGFYFKKMQFSWLFM
jgi:hypothetical protein